MRPCSLNGANANMVVNSHHHFAGSALAHEPSPSPHNSIMDSTACKDSDWLSPSSFSSFNLFHSFNFFRLMMNDKTFPLYSNTGVSILPAFFPFHFSQMASIRPWNDLERNVIHRSIDGHFVHIS